MSFEKTQCHDSTSVGFCTATKRRLWQLCHALPLNLLHAWPHRTWVKIHLVVCDCPDTLNWVLAHCQPAIWADLLRVYETNGQMPYWHASVGKNTAHMVAEEADIVVNVDGDNLIGPNYPLDILSRFHNGKKVLKYEFREGTCGRIACYRTAKVTMQCFAIKQSFEPCYLSLH